MPASNFSGTDPVMVEDKIEEEEETPEMPPASGDHEETGSKKRQICQRGCDRPASVCLCPYLPPSPLSTAADILILHHPHESRHKLATAPVLTRCLLNVHLVVGRRLLPGSSPLLDSLHLSPSHVRRPALLLFPPTPSHPSLDLRSWASSAAPSSPAPVIVVVDATWKHAREMVAASWGFLAEVVTRVCLSCDEAEEGPSVVDSELVLRKEPFRGCVSTMEAVARAVGVVERGGGEIEERLIDVLRAMARFQSQNFKVVKLRAKLGKRGKVVET